MNTLANKIEAILFFKGEPLSIKKLAEICKTETKDIEASLGELKSRTGGVVLIESGGEYTLGTAPEFSDTIEELQKEELNKTLTKSSLETLSIILYKNGASRAEIDYIRGVNSSFTLRALSVRGLVDKVPDPLDARKYVYKPTIELLSYMGVTQVSDLPEYADVEGKMSQIKDPVTEKEEDAK